MKQWATFEDAWRDFAQAGLHLEEEGLSPMFEEFCRGVFYAGALAWSGLFNELMSATGENTPQREAAIRGLFEELGRYMAYAVAQQQREGGMTQ